MSGLQIITDTELASYLDTEVTSGLTLIASLVNDEINEAWTSPPATVDDVPARVRAMALNVAARAAGNVKGLTSWTKAWDDITVTERMEAGTLEEKRGVFLTDDDLEVLNGPPVIPRSVGTIHTAYRGEFRRTPWC